MHLLPPPPTTPMTSYEGASTLTHVFEKNLQLRKINARWIPHLLINEQNRVTGNIENVKKLLKLSKIHTKKTFYD